MSELSWGVWGIRFLISMAGAAALSFVVADYVVRANSSSANETMRALQSSIDRLNESVIANSGRLDTFTASMTTLMERSASSATEIAAMREDISRVQAAVQDAGIDIRIGSDAEGRKLQWGEIRDFYQIEKGAPIFLEVGSSSD